MNVKDGYALQLAVKKNIPCAVISGGNGIGAAIRLEKLGITHIFLNVTDKMQILEEFLTTHKLGWAETLYMGDDIPDYPGHEKSGHALCAG